MPITQARMKALIDIADEAVQWKKYLEIISTSETKAALDEFYANSGNDNPLASLLLARIQTINSYIEQQMLSPASLEVLVVERTHFKTHEKHNIRSARSMQKKRQQNSAPNPI